MSQPEPLTERAAAGSWGVYEYGNDGSVTDITAEVRRQRAELAALEMLAPQQCPAGLHADWLVDSECAHACPWCQIEAHRLALSEALHLGNGAPWDAIADRAGELSRRDIEAVTPDAAPVPPVAPLAASQPSEARREGETATRAATGRTGDPQAPGIRQPVGDLAAADNPTHLRWGLNDVLWSDDDSVIVLLSDAETGKPYWLELDPERAAVLRQDLAGPFTEETHIVADDSSDPEHIDDRPGCDATT